MNQQSYSNREIDEKFGTIIGKLDTIHAQTTKTNGRVNRLENWKWFITGGLTIIGLTLIPIALALIQIYKK